MRKILFLCLLCLFYAASAANLRAAGLSTGFSEVLLEGLDVGTSYSTDEAAGLPLIVVNTGDEPVDLEVEVLLPDASELRKGFEAIPDLNWIQLKKAHFKNIKPREAAVTDVIISIPDSPGLKGRKFQVFIWSHTTGRSIGVGLKSRLLFTVR